MDGNICICLSANPADWASARHRNPRRCKATEVLCHLFYQLKAGAVLLFKQLLPWLPSSAGYTGKPQAVDRPVGPPCSEPFIWHLMWKTRPGPFQTCSIKFHTLQNYHLKNTDLQHNVLIATERYKSVVFTDFGIYSFFPIIKGTKKLSCINQWP